jgi:hypothetical protein
MVIGVYWYFWLGHWCVLVFLVGSLVCIGIFGWVIGVYWYFWLGHWCVLVAISWLCRDSQT